jgi:hypothetical protein
MSSAMILRKANHFIIPWSMAGVAKLFGLRAKFQEKIVLRVAKKLMKLFSPKRG